MREIALEGGFGIENLTERDVEVPAPGEQELLVRMEAASLNYVDLAIIEGTLDPSLRLPFVPVADGAGVVEQVGPLVDGFRVGDLVTTMYIPPWRSGRYERRYMSLAIRPGGGHVPGQLVQYKLFTPEEVVLAPPYLSATEAATLPIAALTAWNALAYGEARAGDAVLIYGTVKLARFRGHFPLGGEGSTNGQKTSQGLSDGLPAEGRRARPSRPAAGRSRARIRPRSANGPQLDQAV